MGRMGSRISRIRKYNNQTVIMLGFTFVLAIIGRFMNHSDIMSGDVKEGLDGPGDDSTYAGIVLIVVCFFSCILVMVRIKTNWGEGGILNSEDGVLKWGVLVALWSMTVGILMFIYPSGDANRNVHMYGGISMAVVPFMFVIANDLYIVNREYDSPIYNTLRWFYPIALSSCGYWYLLFFHTDIIKDGTVADPQWLSIVKMFAPLLVSPVIVLVFLAILTSTT